MENFLRVKLQKDFLDCIELDKAILLGNIRKEEGTLMLFDLIDYVKSDIATMDRASWDILCEAERKILDENEKRKDLIIEHKRVKDSSERRDLEITLLREDYKACKEMLYFLQNLGFKAGWFQ
jgi:hypothetical protein